MGVQIKPVNTSSVQQVNPQNAIAQAQRVSEQANAEEAPPPETQETAPPPSDSNVGNNVDMLA